MHFTQTYNETENVLKNEILKVSQKYTDIAYILNLRLQEAKTEVGEFEQILLDFAIAMDEELELFINTTV